MSQELGHLAIRIRQELSDLSKILDRIQEGWRRAKYSADDYYLDSVALNLHGWYSGVERVFTLIATVIDGTQPTGDMWHKTLLQQMASEIPDIRPAVISQTTVNQLDEYRGFRHIVRNVYTFNFSVVKIESLVENLPQAFFQVQAELKAFAGFLEYLK